MFIVQPFDHDTDVVLINDWLSKHNHEPVVHDELPTIGVIVLDEKTLSGVSVGFLRLVEGRIGMIDSMVTNPDEPLCKRSRAIDMVFETLINTAKSQGLRYLMGCSETGTSKRAQKKFGFSVVSQQVLVKQLNDLTPMKTGLE